MNPQTLSARASQVVIDDFQQVTIPLPVNRVSVGNKNTAQVIEALWVEFDFSGMIGVLSAAGQHITGQLLMQSRTVLVNIDDTAMVAKSQIRVRALAGVAGLQVTEQVHRVNLTDAAGHGLLIPTENIFLGVGSNGQGAAGSIAMRMAYRLKDVSLQEYVGFAVQFTQG